MGQHFAKVLDQSFFVVANVDTLQKRIGMKAEEDGTTNVADLFDALLQSISCHLTY